MRLLAPIAVAIVAVAVIATQCHCYHLPEWNGEVSISPITRQAVAICGDGALTVEGAKQISRQPYLQSTSSTSTSIVWGSKNGEGEVIVRGPQGETVATVPARYAGDPAKQTARLDKLKAHDVGHGVTAKDIYLLSAKVSDLSARHLYCYQLVHNGLELTAPAPLVTAAAPNDSDAIRFVALGDTGTGGAAQAGIAKRLSGEKLDFLLFLGDIAYESGTEAQLQSKFFEVYRDLLRLVPSFQSIGNHERRTRKGAPYFEAFVLPGEERYYSFDWGDVHFVAFDTTRIDEPQLEWLAADLARNTLPWTIAFGHHPLYSNSLRGPQRKVRSAFGPIFARHRVDLVLSGHEHHYERFSILGNNYIVSGGGGGRLTRLFGKLLAVKQKAVHHYLSFEVTASRLQMKVVDIEGNIVETIELTPGLGGNQSVLRRIRP